MVDDKENFLSMLKRILPEDLDVVCAQDGAQALALLDAERFDVVLTDVRMPNVDGIELLEQVRRRDPNVQVVVMTAFGTIPSAVTAMKLGAVEYLTKPFEPEDVIKAVTVALARRADPGAAATTAPTALPYRVALAAEQGRAARSYLVQLLTDAQGNVTHAAEKAGVERESLHRLLKRHGLRAEDYRPKG